VGLPAFFYTPETGFGGGPAVGYIFPRLGDRHPSSVMGVFFYTEKKQTIFAITPEIYLEGGFHGVAEVQYEKFPDSFWGIGPETEDDDEEKFTPELMEVRLVGEFELYPDLRAGLQFEYRREVILEKEEGGLLEGRDITGSTGGTTAGAGLIASYDTRDNIFSAERGWYIELSHETYGGQISNFSFTHVSLDVRRFFSLPWSHVFAARVFGRHVDGRVPFQEMSTLGGPGDMRGYQAGRYRDDFAAYIQAEYRMPILWRFWLAAFGSAGNVSPDPGRYSFHGVKYAGGGGVRFRMNEERFTIRCDYAVTGEGGSNFYLSINEAF
jgi:outer membrane protein assembly factor BamA